MVRQFTKDCIKFVQDTGPDELFRAKRIAKYENHLDFWHGYYLGTLVGQANQVFIDEFGREPTNEEHFEIEEIFAEFENQLVEAVKTTE